MGEAVNTAPDSVPCANISPNLSPSAVNGAPTGRAAWWVVLRNPIQSRVTWRVVPRLCVYPEEVLDEFCLPHHILSADPFQLPFTHHVQSLDAFYRSLSGRSGNIAPLAVSSLWLYDPAR